MKKSSKIKKTEKSVKTSDEKKERYFEAVGRRKTSVARVRIFTKKSGIEINGRKIENYFPLAVLREKILSPIDKMKIGGKLGMTIVVRGGGPTGQAEAVRLGVSRALVKFNAEFAKRLRRLGYLTRDSRKIERKKYGLKKARRAPQWRKR